MFVVNVQLFIVTRLYREEWDVQTKLCERKEVDEAHTLGKEGENGNSGNVKKQKCKVENREVRVK